MKIGGWVMKITTTLEEIIKSELLNQGHSEYLSKDKERLIFFDDDYQIIKKIMHYDDDVHQIVTERFFIGEGLDDTEKDKDFKKHWLNRFYAKQIAHQTLERFASNVLTVFYNNKHFLNEYYNNLDDYLNSLEQSTGQTTGNRLSDNRLLESDLPQNEINLNVDNTVLNYGNLNRISRDRDKQDGTDESQTTKKNLELLKQSRYLMEEVLNDFERQCFLFVW